MFNLREALQMGEDLESLYAPGRWPPPSGNTWEGMK